MDLQNHLLIANDPNCAAALSQTLIYICQHDKQGTMGLIINQLCGLQLRDIFKSLSIRMPDESLATKPVFTGGPIEADVGFVLHTEEGTRTDWHSSLAVGNGLCVTTSKDIMHAMARNQGPKHALLTLGYSGWGEGQLEDEIHQQQWLTCYANPSIIFNTPIKQRWAAAQSLRGIAAHQFCSMVGHA